MRHLPLVLLLAATPAALAQTSPITPGPLTVRLTPYTSIVPSDGIPQDLVPSPDGSGRNFITTRNGFLLSASPTGTLAPIPYLNLTAAGISLYTDGEGGFPAVAFSPTFNTPSTPGFGKFYTFTTETYSVTNPPDFSSPELAPTTNVTPANQIVIREWTATPGAPTANTTSRVLLRINHPQSNHQGGQLSFGPDGDLYIGLGDGGSGNDFAGSPSSTTDGHNNTLGNGQDTSVPFGKILRIDPNGNNSANGQYGIPTDNPFATSPTSMKEIFAYGLRNPYRFSFNSSTGQLYAGDVGQGNREEVDIIQNGGNYGWPFREGTRDNSADAGRTTPPSFSSLLPLAEYTHADGDSIMGGFVYHGSLIPSLTNQYIFGDYQGTTGNGRLFYTNADPNSADHTIHEFTYDLTNGGLLPPSSLLSFGQNNQGELYALFANGSILQFTPTPEPTSALACLFATFPLLRRQKR